MRLLCHDVGCEGHDRSAGSDPGGSCGYCGAPLADPWGTLLLESVGSAEPIITADLIAVGVCSAHGHVWEGRLPPGLEELRGSCARCGLRIALSV